MEFQARFWASKEKLITNNQIIARLEKLGNQSISQSVGAIP